MYQGQPWHGYCKTSNNRVSRSIGPNGACPDVTRLSGIYCSYFRRFRSVYNLRLLLVIFCLWLVVVEAATVSLAEHGVFWQGLPTDRLICAGKTVLFVVHICNGVCRKFRRGAKVSSQLCDVTNQLYGECRRHEHSRVVRGRAPRKFCEIASKNTHFPAFWKQVLV